MRESFEAPLSRACVFSLISDSWWGVPNVRVSLGIIVALSGIALRGTILGAGGRIGPASQMRGQMLTLWGWRQQNKNFRNLRANGASFWILLCGNLSCLRAWTFPPTGHLRIPIALSVRACVKIVRGYGRGGRLRHLLPSFGRATVPLAPWLVLSQFRTLAGRGIRLGARLWVARSRGFFVSHLLRGRTWGLRSSLLGGDGFLWLGALFLAFWLLKVRVRVIQSWVWLRLVSLWSAD